jgi:predicted nucleic acid-binding protein
LNRNPVELTLHAIVRDAPDIDVDIPDPDDRFLFSLMREFEQSVLITGDKALLDHSPPWASVVTPSDFVALLHQP